MNKMLLSDFRLLILSRKELFHLSIHKILNSPFATAFKALEVVKVIFVMKQELFYAHLLWRLY